MPLLPRRLRDPLAFAISLGAEHLLLGGCVCGLGANRSPIGGRNRCTVGVSSYGGTCGAVCWLREIRGAFANSGWRIAGPTAALLLLSRRYALLSWRCYALTLEGSLAANVCWLREIRGPSPILAVHCEVHGGLAAGQ